MLHGFLRHSTGVIDGTKAMNNLARTYDPRNSYASRAPSIPNSPPGLPHFASTRPLPIPYITHLAPPRPSLPFSRRATSTTSSTLKISLLWFAQMPTRRGEPMEAFLASDPARPITLHSHVLPTTRSFRLGTPSSPYVLSFAKRAAFNAQALAQP